MGFEQRGLALAAVFTIDWRSKYGPLLIFTCCLWINYRVVEGIEGDNTYKGQLSSYALRS